MPVKMIGDILTAQLPHMQPYIRFCSCQLNGAALIQQKTDEAPDFKEFVKVRSPGSAESLPPKGPSAGSWCAVARAWRVSAAQEGAWPSPAGVTGAVGLGLAGRDQRCAGNSNLQSRCMWCSCNTGLKSFVSFSGLGGLAGLRSPILISLSALIFLLLCALC